MAVLMTMRIAPEDRWLPTRRARRGVWARIARGVRRVPPALVISLGLHAGLLAGALLFLHAGGPAMDTPDKETAVELVMVERQGDARPVPAVPPAPPAPPMPRVAPEPRVEPAPEPKPQVAETEPRPAEPPIQTPLEAQEKRAEEERETPKVSETVPPPEKNQPARTAREEAKPEPAAPPPAPRISLSGTDSPSNALAEGNRVIPAAADAVFHNKPPPYPAEAVRRGQRGAVVVVIHISPEGRAAAVDVVSSSGYALLDQAVSEAVLAWRFLPAMQGGRAVASNMPMRFIFDNE